MAKLQGARQAIPVLPDPREQERSRGPHRLPKQPPGDSACTLGPKMRSTTGMGPLLGYKIVKPRQQRQGFPDTITALGSLFHDGP